MSEPLTFGSLFAGIGGLDLGLERAGMRCVWQVEIDPYCRAVLAKHWPDVTRYEDVRDVGERNLASVDVICGGFPCQDVSVAGKRAGIRGKRSGLWAEYTRIICELQPRYVVVENVTGLLANGMGVVLGELAAIGYDAEWDCVPASAVGAPHQRDRVWIVAYPAGGRHGQGLRVSVRPRGQVETAPDVERMGTTLADSDEPRLEGRLVGVMSERPGQRPPRSGRASSANTDRQHDDDRRHGAGPARRQRSDQAALQEGWWESEPDVGRVAHGVPSRVDRLRALGNAVVPQVAEVIGRLIVRSHEALESVA